MNYVVSWFSLVLLSFSVLQAAPIPGLFNTGLDDQGNRLPPGSIDPHYVLIRSADPAHPGPNSFVVTPNLAWATETATSAWISPSASTAVNYGQYTFRLYLDFTQLKPETARISGNHSADNGVSDIRLNGVSIGGVVVGGFDRRSPFTIDSGFVAGTNTLDFVVFAGFVSADVGVPNTGDATGIIIEMEGFADQVPDRKIRIPTVFGTGLDAGFAALPVGAVDPHYKLILNPESNISGQNAVVTTPNGGWLGTNGIARWISSNPNQDSRGGLAGDYTYETTFDLAGYDLSKITILGRVMNDDTCSIKLNGNTLPIAPSGFMAWTPFELKEGLLPGINTLQFLVVNAGPQPSPTGLRVDFDAFYIIPEDKTPAMLSIDRDLKLTLVGPADRNYSIQYVDQFADPFNWSELRRIKLAQEPFLFDDETRPIEGLPSRYYRAVLVP